MSTLPDFVIIGAQKAASTYVHLALREHPGVCMPKEEVRFFEDPEFGDGSPRRLEILFSGCPDRLKGIKRPDYLARPEVPGRILRLLPEARLIAVLREPVSRLVSAYHYYIKIGLIPAVPFERGVTELLRQGTLGARRSAELLEYGRYGTHLERYLAHFDAARLCVLIQEQMLTEPGAGMAGVLDFLGLAPYQRPPTVARDNAGLYPLPRLRFIRLRNRFLYDYDPASGKLVPKTGAWRYLLAGMITAVDRSALAMVLPNRKPQMSGALRARLIEYYAPEVAKVEQLLGRGIPLWRRGDTRP